MRLCVKLAAHKIKNLTNEVVNEEIERTKQSKRDSLGVLREESATMETLE